MAYKVTKPIPKGDGSVIPTGTMVDAAKWRNLRTLISGRYLVEVLEVAPKVAPKAEPVVSPVVVDDVPAVEVKQTVKPKKVKNNVNQ